MGKTKDSDSKSDDALVLWNVRLPASLLVLLRKRAKEQDRSASWLARHYIAEGLERKKSLT